MGYLNFFISFFSVGLIAESRSFSLNSRIFNGELAAKNQFPYQASITFSYKTSNFRDVDWHCSGSILSTIWILTCAHCTLEYFYLKSLKDLINFENIVQKKLLYMWEA